MRPRLAIRSHRSERALAPLREVTKQLPWRRHTGRPHAEDALDDRDAGQRRQEGVTRPRGGLIGSTGEDHVPLIRVQPTRVLGGRKVEVPEHDAVEERVAGEPRRAVADDREAMAKARSEHSEPGALGAVDENRERRPAGTVVRRIQATEPRVARSCRARLGIITRRIGRKSYSLNLRWPRLSMLWLVSY